MSVPSTVAARSTDFLSAERANRRATAILVGLLLLLGIALGASLFAALWLEFGDAPVTGWTDLVVPAGFGALAFGGLGSLYSALMLSIGDRMVLGLADAGEVAPGEEPVLHNVVAEMAIAAGLPKPRVMVVESPALNAFATGLRSDDGAIAVTRGLLQALDREELQGVVAHEMGHIRNLDTLYLTAIALFAGLIALVADVGVRALRIGRGVGRDSDRKGGGAIAVVVFALALLLAVLAPMVAGFVRMAVSRQREYLADATAVRFTRNPQGLIGALEKIDRGTFPLPGANRAMQHMYIVNPLDRFDPDPGALWSTHPATADRIARLRNLAG